MLNISGEWSPIPLVTISIQKKLSRMYVWFIRVYVNTASKKELTARFLSLGVQGTFCMERSVVFVCSGGIAVFVKKVLG